MADEGETTEHGEAGRALVRRLLIERLQNAGLVRARRQSEKALADSIAHLVATLDHMTAENLHTLADVVLDHAASAGAAKGQWPAEVLILSWAKALQPRPFEMQRIVTSWLASVEGPVAEAGGYLVQLYRFLRWYRRPPLAYDLAVTIRDAAREDNSRLTLIAHRIACGVAVAADDLAWHEAYLRDEMQARSYVDQGRSRRAAAGRVAV